MKKVSFIIILLLLYILSCTEQMVLVSISSSGYGRVTFYNSAESAIEVASGTKVTVIATPDENCEFKGWYVGNSDTPVSTEATYTFSANGDVALIAKFNEIKKIISVATSGNGSVAIKNKAGSSAEFVFGTTVSIVATPDEGYDFVGWFVNGSNTPVSTDATYTFTVSEDVSFIGKFVQAKKTVSVIANGNGRVTITNNGSEFAELAAGTSVAVSAIPDENYKFKGWYVANSDTPVSTNEVYIFTLSEDVILVAKFASPSDDIEPVQVSISSSGNGRVTFYNSAENAIEVSSGTKVTVVATPDENCKFKGWYVGNSETPVSTEATYTFSASDDVVLIAKFVKPINVSVIANGNGRVTITNNGSEFAELAAGTSVAVSAIPDENYKFKGWYVANSDTPVSTNEVYIFTLSEDVILVAKFASPSDDIEPVEIDLNPSGSIGGYDYVDLGLSVKWATYNVGASCLEEIGEYYAWGESTPYNRDFTFVNYGWSHFPCSPDRVLASIYDAATVNWGKQWRMPTYDEQKELLNACDWMWMDNINGSSVSGYIGVSRINRKCIFLPATKFITHDKYNQPIETDAVYWSSTSTGVPGSLGLQSASTADCIIFDNKKNNPVCWGIWQMGDGATIRPVVGKPNDYFPDPADNVIDEAETARQGYTVNGKIGSHTYVDMGLPSGTLWATYNVGAEMPGEYGGHYAWGETSPKELYTLDTYAFFNGYSDALYSYSQYTKYVWHDRHGVVDGKLILEPEDDAATVNMGEEWCMPTVEQYEELDKYCKVWRKDIVVNGKTIIGAIVESCINGNRMYIPYAGWEYGSVPNNYMHGWYWTSDISREANYRAKQMIVKDEDYILDTSQDSNRENGLSVRAVVKKTK